jgi:hypothetical protein
MLALLSGKKAFPLSPSLLILPAWRLLLVHFYPWLCLKWGLEKNAFLGDHITFTAYLLWAPFALSFVGKASDFIDTVLFSKLSKINAGEVAQVVQWLSSKHKALSLIPCTAQKQQQLVLLTYRCFHMNIKIAIILTGHNSYHTY